MKYIGSILAFCVGCSPAIPTAQQQEKVVSYEAALQGCIKLNDKQADVDACACNVSKIFDRAADAGLCK